MTSQGEIDDIGTSSLNSGSEEAPLWNYVTKLDKSKTKGGTWKFKCNLCNESRQGSYSRIRAHFLGIQDKDIAICKKVTRTQRAEMQKLEDEFERKKNDSRRRSVPLPCETNSSSKKRKVDSSPIARAFGIEARDQLDQEIARMFFTGGLAFNLAKNPHYHSSDPISLLLLTKLMVMCLPGYNKLRTTLLQKEKTNIENLLIPLKSTWKERGVTIVSDGWSDPTRKPLINFIATSGSAPLFLKAVNCFGEVKDRFFISDLMENVINEVGHQNVVQIITDNASNCKAAGEIIESMFPHIYWTPCVVHTLNLALKNICAAKNVDRNEHIKSATG